MDQYPYYSTPNEDDSSASYDREKQYDNFNYSDFFSNCNVNYLYSPYPDDGRLYCNVTFDQVLCWPHTLAGSTATQPCPANLNGILYDTSKSVYKRCYPNGTWSNYSDYKACRHLVDMDPNVGEEDLATLIFFIGQSLSLVAVVIALAIFLNFKDLRCLRNTFHVNLLATYLLNALFWIITASLNIGTDQNHLAPCVMMAILYYCQGTNFFWMFVEGFYLYMLVVRTFTVDKIRFRVYIFFGWGVPAIIVAIWAIVKAKLSQPALTNETVSTCPWLVKDNYEWIFSGPILLVLVVNMIFLGIIMWVLITKLRAATTAESQQYRKASKALLVLIPLLGITYVVVLVAPKQGLMATVLIYTRAVLISTQGFTVSVLYCFLNGEVRNTLRHHWEAWRSSRDLPGGLTSFSRYRDGSPRSRTESIRLCSAVANDCKCDAVSNAANRESCVSCLTTHSYVGNGHSKGSGGGGGNNHVQESHLIIVTQNTAGNDVDGTHSHLARSGTTSTVNSIKENSV